MKKIVLAFVLALAVVFSTAAFADSEVIKVNTVDGTVGINYGATDYSDLKVLVQKDGKRYAYNLFSANESFPLQMGNGSYTVSVCQKVSGSEYKVVESNTFDLNMNQDTVYLASTQNVEWSSASATSQLAKKLTAKAKTDVEKVQIVRDYVMSHIAYDYDKASSVGTRYVPSVERTLASGKGICYDYASVTASMLRSLGIPTKLVKGHSNYTGSTFHAWNEVNVNGNWIVVDATTDSVFKANGVDVQMNKDASDYTAEQVF